jgi:glycosyltransferase involved in cell wall biosynthesis
MPVIDVLMPVRNGIPFLGEAIESIRNQTFSDWRLIILDHGSQDGSAELGNRYAEFDERIKIFSFADADGIAELRNFGLEKCDCKYLLLQDADDISLPNRMSIVTDTFGASPKLLALGGDAILIDDAGRQIGYLHMPTDPAAVTAAGFFYYPMVHPSVAANFAALKRYGALYGKDFLNVVPAHESIVIKRLAEDYILFGQLALVGPCANVGTPLVKYRRHTASVGNLHPLMQTKLALQVSRFLAKSFCTLKAVQEFDPAPFCNHGEHVFDFGLEDHNDQFEQMAVALRGGLGQSKELERELAFRWVLATRNSARMAARYFQFRLKYDPTPSERRTVRNWLLRGIRKGKYVYRAAEE